MTPLESAARAIPAQQESVEPFLPKLVPKSLNVVWNEEFEQSVQESIKERDDATISGEDVMRHELNKERLLRSLHKKDGITQDRELLTSVQTRLVEEQNALKEVVKKNPLSFPENRRLTQVQNALDHLAIFGEKFNDRKYESDSDQSPEIILNSPLRPHTVPLPRGYQGQVGDMDLLGVETWHTEARMELKDLFNSFTIENKTKEKKSKHVIDKTIEKVLVSGSQLYGVELAEHVFDKGFEEYFSTLFENVLPIPDSAYDDESPDYPLVILKEIVTDLLKREFKAFSKDYGHSFPPDTMLRQFTKTIPRRLLAYRSMIGRDFWHKLKNAMRVRFGNVEEYETARRLTTFLYMKDGEQSRMAFLVLAEYIKNIAKKM